MRPIVWTQQSLAEALNTRMDQGILNGEDFIMPKEIPDEVLSEWQKFHDAYRNEPAMVEAEYIHVYEAVVASFK